MTLITYSQLQRSPRVAILATKSGPRKVDPPVIGTLLRSGLGFASASLPSSLRVALDFFSADRASLGARRGRQWQTAGG